MKFQTLFESMKIDSGAGILLYHKNDDDISVFLITPGGPYFKFGKKEKWGIPKGKIDKGETPINCAKREFFEETGIKLPKGKLIDLGVTTRGGGNPKSLYVWAVEGTGKEKFIKSNTFKLEWPPKSGKIQKFPEIHTGKFFSIEKAKEVVPSYQIAYLLRLEQELS